MPKNQTPGIYTGRVISVNDPMVAERILTRIDAQGAEDKYAFPLMPKLFKVKPKVGESVLIFTAIADDPNSQRYYLGPIIPQYNFLKKAEYTISSAALEGGFGEQKSINDIPETKGSFADDDDVAIYGRGKSDIILGENDVIIRCGARVTDDLPEHGEPLDKPIAFNEQNPSYIKFSYSDGTIYGEEKNSSINIIADDINIISNNSVDKNGRSFDKEIKDKDNRMLSPETIASLKDRLHEVPYGDVLIEYLDIMRLAFATHVHPYAGTPPIEGTPEIQKMNNFDTKGILSKHIKIS